MGLRKNQPETKQQQQIFLLLVDDGRGAATSQLQGTSTNQLGTFASVLVASSVTAPGFQVLAAHPQWGKQQQAPQMPRMACAVYSHPLGCGGGGGGGQLLYGSECTIHTLPAELLLWEPSKSKPTTTTTIASTSAKKRFSFTHAQLPPPGIRSGQDAMVVTAGGTVVVVAVKNSFYAVAGKEQDDEEAVGRTVASSSNNTTNASSVLKILTFQQSSQVYPVIAIDLLDRSMEPDWSSLFLASGRECAVVDLYAAANDPICSSSDDETILNCSKPRNGTVTVPSPILAAATSWPWVAFLQSDGLISIRSPSCLAIPLRTIEVGQRPNDYFTLRASAGVGVPQSGGDGLTPWIVAVAYSGECKVLKCKPDSVQELSDRLLRLAIDAFGTNGFPRAELAEAVNASFTAASYTGPEASPQARTLLKQYLEAVLGLSDFESGSQPGWPTETNKGEARHGTFAGNVLGVDNRASFSGRGEAPTAISSASPAALLTGTALLCLVCSQLNPLASVLACRAAKVCSEKNGISFAGTGTIFNATVQVCELVAEKLLREASSKFSLLAGSSPAPIAGVHRSSQSSTMTDFVEAATWLLRSCGRHERAIEVSYERLQQQGQLQSGTDGADTVVRGFWSQIKFDSFTATHLSDIWSANAEEGCRLVLSSPATLRLLVNNPRLGLSVFTALHPQNDTQWRLMAARDDPLAHPERVYGVLNLLKSINPSIPVDNERSGAAEETTSLPLESGRAIAVAFLRSAIGISTGRPVHHIDSFDCLPADENFEESIANFHDELSLLLLEGVLSERSDNELDTTTGNALGQMYQTMLREFLKWPLAKVRPDHFMESLPATFLQEKALLLGRIGRHEDALRILYCELGSLELALAYCDDRFSKQKAQYELRRGQMQQGHLNYFNADPSDELLDLKDKDNAYIPLVRVALESSDREDGTSNAIKVLTLRRGAVDRAAALRLLPSDVPVSAVARPFLIPALVDGESQVRRMSVVSALLRSRYMLLKDKLTTAQLMAQANINVVPALRCLKLGDPLHSTKSFRARTTSSSPGNTLPYIEIVKHFFPRYLVIQAKVTNVPYNSRQSVTSSSALYGGASFDKTNGTSASQAPILSDIAFVMAECSEEEAIQSMLQVPIPMLPPRLTGSAWCVLSASPANMDGPTASLSCELRYTVQSALDSSSSSSSSMIRPGLPIATSSRTLVEELQEIEVHAAHFSPKSMF